MLKQKRCNIAKPLPRRKQILNTKGNVVLFCNENNKNDN